jgi:hypothetical protein
MRPTAWTLGVLAGLAGCAGGGEPPIPRPDVAGAGPILMEVPARGDGTFRPRDFGVGVLAWTSVIPGGLAEGMTDTLRFLAQPEREAPMVGGLVVRREGAYGWSHWALLQPGDVPNLLEYGYEEIGAPLLATTADSAWAEVLFGHGPDGTSRTGWAPVEAGAVHLVQWRELLPTYPLFLLPTSTGLHAAPDGALLDGGLPDAEDDYILHVEAREGDWLQVRLVTPADYCADPVSPAVRRGWVRYLDPVGRPTVWYYTRGC